MVFVFCWYTLSSVLAFDWTFYKANNNSYNVSQNEETFSLHTQIESDVANWVKNIRNNLVSFMQDGLSSKREESNTPNNVSNNTYSFAVEPVHTSAEKTIRMTYPDSESALLPAFADIQNDPERYDIEILASIWLVQWDGNGKYNPKNHVRCSDFVRVIVDLYRYLLGYSITGTSWLTDKHLLDLKEPNSLLWKKLNTAKELWMLEWVDNLVRDKPITPLQVKQIINNTLALHLNFGQKESVNEIDLSKSVLTKSEMAKYLVEIFQLKFPQNENAFSDISNHKYHAAITKLAQLGVVAGRDGKFYPDTYAHRSDGIIMIANSILAKQEKALVIKDFYHLNAITDVTYFAAYAPHLEYLLDNEIWDSLLYSTQSGYLFSPDTVLTQWEAYTLVAQAAGIKILNADSWAASKPITRGELANLLVEAFEFNTVSQRYEVSTRHIEWNNTVDYAASREERKSLLVSVLKDVVDKL